MEKSKITLRNITWRAGESIKALATISLTISFPGLFGTSVLDKSVHAHEKKHPNTPILNLFSSVS